MIFVVEEFIFRFSGIVSGFINTLAIACYLDFESHSAGILSFAIVLIFRKLPGAGKWILIHEDNDEDDNCCNKRNATGNNTDE